MNDDTWNHETNTPARRAWLAALLLRRPEGFLSRFAAGAARWRGMSRNGRRRAGRRLAATAAGAALALALVAGPLAPTAHAASIDVDDGMVTVVDDGFCSLREAIQNAINDGQVFISAGECAAGSGDDTINLPVDGDFVLDYAYPTPFGYSGLLVGLTTLTIEGNGSTLRRDTADPDEFAIMIIYAADVTLNDVTISGGSGLFGGGLFPFESTLSLVDSTVSGNNAYYIGGGLFGYDSDILIAGSTISGNTAALYGGGVAVTGGMLDVVNSTISGNSAEFIGGLSIGFFPFGPSDPVSATVTNSTITDNTGEYAVGGIVVFDDSALTISRSIVSGNNTDDEVGAEIYNLSDTTLNADSYNVFGHAGLDDYAAFVNFAPGANDVNATSDGAAIPLSGILDPNLADNGGPTLTHNLAVDSPALDMAPDADCAAAPVSALDQRGAARPFDVVGQGNEGADTCDAGSVEAEAPFVGGIEIYLSARAPGTTGDGLDFGPEDILRWDGTEWSLFFDGSAAGLMPFNAKHNINAFSIPDPEEGDFIFSFAQNRRTVPGIAAPVDGMDLIYWNALTEEFSLWFDGSDVGLTNKTAEKIDSLHVLPGSESPIGGGACIDYILISTQGTAKVPNHTGGTLNFRGEDVVGFCATSLGDNTAGLWHMVLDGSAEGMPPNSTDSISVSDDSDTLYLTTRSTFNVDTATGGHSMVYRYDFDTGEFSGPDFIAADEGLEEKVNGLHVEGDLP